MSNIHFLKHVTINYCEIISIKPKAYYIVEVIYIYIYICLCEYAQIKLAYTYHTLKKLDYLSRFCYHTPAHSTSLNKAYKCLDCG